MIANKMLSMIAMATTEAYTPDDGTQGYTPYFYKMDVPVRVRNSISYGRAWQLLRSRGAGSNATGPCDPPQLASSCNCSTTAALPPNPGVTDRDDSDVMPRCTPSPLCGVDASPKVVPGSSAAILLVMDMQRQNVRFPIGNCERCLRNGYQKMVREIIRCLLSLRAVGTALPIYLLVSGLRFAPVEQLLARRYNVHVLPANETSPPLPPMTVPAWASKWARGSFAKLRALALIRFETLVLLDADNVVLRNIDHLAAVPPPAFVFGWKCHPRRELRASTMVLHPQLTDWWRALELLNASSTAVYDDLGEQSVWRKLYADVKELPAGYAALRTADLPAHEWPKVSIVHDAHLIHDVQRAGWHAAGMLTRVVSVDKQATHELREHFASFFNLAPSSGRQTVGKRAGGRGRNRRPKRKRDRVV